MEILVWIGAFLTFLGFLGVIWSVVLVMRARRAGLDDAGLRARIGKALPVNVGAFMLSMLGLIMVVVGIALG
jgi:uncharacterized membrane protein